MSSPRRNFRVENALCISPTKKDRANLGIGGGLMHRKNDFRAGRPHFLLHRGYDAAGTHPKAGSTGLRAPAEPLLVPPQLPPHRKPSVREAASPALDGLYRPR